MKIGGFWLSIARTCIGEVWVRRTTSSGPGVCPSMLRSGERLAGST